VAASWELSSGEEIVPGRVAMDLLGTGLRYETYLAWDEHLRALVVAKLVRPDLVGDRGAMYGIEAEARHLDRLAHPMLLRSFGAHLDGPRPHLVLEHIEGHCVRTMRRTTPRSATPMMRTTPPVTATGPTATTAPVVATTPVTAMPQPATTAAAEATTATSQLQLPPRRPRHWTTAEATTPTTAVVVAATTVAAATADARADGPCPSAGRGRQRLPR